MKTIKILLALLMVMLGTTAFAQDVVVTKTDGTTETIENADSVVYDVKILGYYSFNATSTAEIKNLTASDFTKLTEATSEVPCGVRGLITVLTTGNTSPSAYKYSVMDKCYGDEIVLKPGNDKTGTTISINSVVYNIWYWAVGTDPSDNTKIKLIIK